LPVNGLGGLQPILGNLKISAASARRLRAALVVITHRHWLQFRPIKQTQGNQQVV